MLTTKVNVNIKSTNILYKYYTFYFLNGSSSNKGLKL